MFLFIIYFFVFFFNKKEYPKLLLFATSPNNFGKVLIVFVFLVLIKKNKIK